MFMRDQEMLHRLRYKELQIHAPAMAQHHDEEAQLPTCLTHANRAPTAPVNLSRFARCEHQREERRSMFGPYETDIFFNRAVATGVVFFTQPLEYLLGTERVCIEQPSDFSLEG